MRTVKLIPALAAIAVSAAAATAGEIDSKAQKTLDNLKAFYSGAESFHVAYKTNLNIQMGPMNQDEESTVSIDVAQPNKLAMHTVHPQLGSFDVITNGTDMYTFMDHSMFGRKVYTQEAAPATLAEIQKQAGDLINMAAGPAALDATTIALAIAADPNAAQLFDTLQSAAYLGIDEIDGIPSHHISLEFSTELQGETLNIPIDLWVEQSETAWIRQVVPNLEAMLASLPDNGGMPAGIKLTAKQSLLEASASPSHTDATFAFDAPDGAEKVDSLFDALAQGGAPQPQSGSSEGLAGSPAPAFSLELLSGGTVDLAQHKGKDIVVLDFWATWCGPCIKAMPTIIEVTDQFKDQNVVLYAVNLRETPDKINKFLQQRGFDANILLDKDGAIANAYGARAIPQTVIIDKQGVVQTVHVGAAPDLKTLLSGELQKVVNGENLY